MPLHVRLDGTVIDISASYLTSVFQSRLESRSNPYFKLLFVWVLNLLYWLQILDADDERPSDQDDGFVIEDDVAMSVDDFIDENDPPEELNTSPLSDSDDNKTNEEDDDDVDENR